MKSYSVKSNAKRFARGVAAKYRGEVEAAEPVKVLIDGVREWYPAVSVQSGDNETCARVAAEFPDAVYIYGFTDEEASKAVAAAMAEGDAGVYNNPAEDISEIAAPVASAIIPPSVMKHVGKKGRSETIMTGGPRGGKKAVAEAIAAKDITPEAKTMAAAATLPPPTRSTPEEIAARRAERRNRIDAEKADGTRDASGNKVKEEKISKKKIIIDLMRREEGATQKELEDGTGWQRHTLRGYIAGTLRKKLGAVGFDINCERGSGEAPTRYFIEPKKAEAKGGEA